MSLLLDDYQRAVAECAINRALFGSLDYLVCGLIGETGELAEEIKRLIREDGGTLTDARRGRIVEEAGDVLWHVAALGSLHEFALSLCGADTFADLASPLQDIGIGAHADGRAVWTPVRSVCSLAMHVGGCAHSARPKYGYLDRMADMMTALARVVLSVRCTPEHTAEVNMAKIRTIQERARTGRTRVQYDPAVLHDEVTR